MPPRYAKPSIALATVTSPSFLVGTQVMIHSFLAHNRWFDGDIIVFCADPDDRVAPTLEAQFPRVSCRRASAELDAAIDHLVAARPDLATRRDRFLSLESFALTGYDKVLFCDSDLLFQGDVAGLLEGETRLVACPDGAMLRGNRRDRMTLEEIAADDGDPLATSFNAGLMLIDAALRGPAIAEALRARLAPTAWQAVLSQHTDQAVLNLEFHECVTLVSTAYNLMIGHRIDSHASEPVRLSEAKVLHFNGPAKPWRMDRQLAGASRDAALIEALRYWYDAYLAMLTAHHFNQGRTA